MGDVIIKVRVSHLALGEITKEGVENKTIYKRNDEFVCSEEQAKKLGTSVMIIGKIPDPEKPIEKPMKK